MSLQRHQVLMRELQATSRRSSLVTSSATGASPVAPPRRRRASGGSDSTASGNGGRPGGDGGDGGNGPAVLAAIPATAAAAALGVSTDPAGGQAAGPSTSTPRGHTRQGSDSGRGLSVSSILRSSTMPRLGTGEALLLLDVTHAVLRSNF